MFAGRLKIDPARAAGRLLAVALFGAPKVKKARRDRDRNANVADDDEDEGAVSAAVDALQACVERFCSPNVLFEDRTRFAVTDAHRLVGETPVDTKQLLERIDALRARLALLERRGLEHLPESAYLRTQCTELLAQWRSSRAAQGELTGQQPAPPPPAWRPIPPPPMPTGPALPSTAPEFVDDDVRGALSESL